jgi:hypothetical protein
MASSVSEKALTWTEFEQLYKQNPEQPIQRTWVEFVAPRQQGFNGKWYFASIFPNAERTKIINFFQWDEVPLSPNLLWYSMKTVTLDDKIREIQTPSIRILGSNPHQKVFQEVYDLLGVTELAKLVLSFIPSFTSAAQTIEAHTEKTLNAFTFKPMSDFFSRQDEEFAKRQQLSKNETG